MKSKLKIVVVTFLATTVFWGLFLVGLFWWGTHGHGTEVSWIDDAVSHGYLNLMRVWNDETQPVTFTVAEIRTNTTGTNTLEAILLERQLQPSGEFWVGIKKNKSQSK